MPTDVAQWGSTLTPGADLTVPGSTEKLGGWQVGKPRRQYMNWWQQAVYRWVAWLAGFEAENFAWTGTHDFTGATVTYGAFVGASITISGVATFNGTTNLNQGATVPTGKTLTLAGTAKIAIADNPAASVAVTNELHAKNLPKAWLHGYTNGSGGFTASDGFNMTLASISGNVMTFTLPAALAAGFKACVVVNARLSGGEVVLCSGYADTAAGTIHVVSQGSVSAGTVSNFAAWGTTANVEVSILVFGAQ